MMLKGSIDVIPVAWGGFDRKNAVVNGETIIVEQTLEREFVNFHWSNIPKHCT